MKTLNRVLLLALVYAGNSVAALRIEPGVGVGLEYTDNARLKSEDEDSDWIGVGYVGAMVDYAEGPTTANAVTSFSYQSYADNSYGDKHYFNFGGRARWEQMRNQLDWVTTNYFTQRLKNSDGNDTENNIQNTNVFTFGPNLTLPVADRQVVVLSPLFTDYYYSSTQINNRRYAMTGRWLYQLRPSATLSATGGATKVEYEKSNENPGYVIYNAMLGTTVQRVRSSYSVNAGVTSYDRDKFSSQTGFSGNADLKYNLTANSTASLHASTALTDTSQGLQRSNVSPEDGDFSDEDLSADVLRDSIFRLGYDRRDSTLRSSIWGYVRKLDYKTQPKDRDVQATGVKLDYDITPLWTGGVYGDYRRTDRKDENVTDDRYTAGVRVGYKLSRKLRAAFDVRYRKRSNDNENDEYTETSAFASLTWGFGQVPRPASGRGN